MYLATVCGSDVNIYVMLCGSVMCHGIILCYMLNVLYLTIIISNDQRKDVLGQPSTSL